MEQPPQKSQAERAYAFFLEAEHHQRRFTSEELAEETGYTVGTTKNYLTKKWWWFVKKEHGTYRVEGFHDYPLQEFLVSLQQKTSGPGSVSAPKEPLTRSLGHMTPSVTIICAFVLCAWSILLLLLRKQPWWIVPL